MDNRWMTDAKYWQKSTWTFESVVFYLKKNRMAQRHAPFDKKNVVPCIADVPFFISSNDP
jgi:hypothetical protein